MQNCAQWLSEDHYSANGNAWPKNPKNPDICHGRFEARPTSRFNLKPNGCAIVGVGDAFVPESGASVDCPRILPINKKWRLRASTKTVTRTIINPYAQPSETIEATTLSCRHDLTIGCQANEKCVLTPLGRKCACKVERSPGVCAP
jgi:hypothetical protein